MSHRYFYFHTSFASSKSRQGSYRNSIWPLKLFIRNNCILSFINWFSGTHPSYVTIKNIIIRYWYLAIEWLVPCGSPTYNRWMNVQKLSQCAKWGTCGAVRPRPKAAPVFPSGTISTAYGLLAYTVMFCVHCRLRDYFHTRPLPFWRRRPFRFTGYWRHRWRGASEALSLAY